jgi:hypothetical protein
MTIGLRPGENKMSIFEQNNKKKYICKNCDNIFYEVLPDWQHRYLVTRCPYCYYHGTGIELVGE